jgi:hypothetical protein
MDPVVGFLEREGLPAPERVIALSGALRCADGSKVRPHLCLVGDRVWLAGADRKQGVRIDVLAAQPLRYVPGRLGDKLVVGTHELGIPIGRGDAVRRLLATVRLRGSSRQEPAPPPLSERYVAGLGPVDELWLDTFLDADEPLLAWLPTDTEVTVASELLGEDAVAPWRLFLTSKRAGLVAITALGDVRCEPFPDGTPMTMRSSLGRTYVYVGGVTLRAPWGSGERYQAIAPLVGLAAPDRLLGFAALCWRAGKGAPAARAEARGTLALPAVAAHPLAALSRVVVLADDAPAAAPLQEPPESPGAGRVQHALRDLRRRAGDSSVLADWAVAWQISDEQCLTLLERLLAGDDAEAAATWALPFHRRLHARLLAGARDVLDQAEIDLALAEHLHLCGAHDEMTVLLAVRLAALPAPELGDLVPPAHAQAALPEGGYTARARMCMLLASVRERAAEPLLGLAMLEPLVPAHAARLVGAATGELAAAAREAHAVLLPGGLEVQAEPAPPAVRALPARVVDEVIQHPSTRRSGVLAGVQSLLARMERPDRAVLTSYCERLDSGRHQAALAALRDAAMALGVPGIDGYLSRGDKSIGARAYEGRPPFLLLGVSHLEPGSELAMGPAELRFLIGAEVAHLRFGHTRLTSEDVWNGAWQTGRVGLDLLFTTLPVLRGIHLVDRIQDLLDLYRIPVVGKVLERGVGRVLEKRRARLEGSPEAVHIAPAYEDLLAAHRAMQLTADRAGLLFAGDLRSAIRAIFRSRAEYRAELPIAEHYGLAEALTRADHRGEPGSVVFQDLAIRIAALIAFFLSPEHRAARRALHGEA